MLRRIRTPLFWLLLFALPLQGFASNAMQRCDAMPMPGSPVSSVSASGTQDNMAGLSEQQGTEKSGALDCQGNGLAGAHSSDHSPSGCVGSGACGMAAGFSHRMPTFLHPVAGAAHRIARSILRLGFLTDAPDRPPRTVA